EGTERVIWRNVTEVPAGELRFHLYLNGFEGQASTWMREARAKGRSRDEPLPDYGGIDVDRIDGPGGVDLLPAAEYVAPDDGNAEDRTVLRVPLAEPVPPGGSVSLSLAFRARMPGPWARTGRRGNYVAGAQWYPKLGVFEPGEDHTAGTAGWNCPQFHNFTEFFGDFGSYRVSLTLPERYRGKIAASGVEVGTDVPSDGLVRTTFHADAVHDFSWFADPDFVVATREFRGEAHRDPAEEKHWLDLLGPEAAPEEMALTDVDLEVFLQPQHRHLADRHLDALEASLEWFGRAFGSYPYPVLRAVDPQNDARATSGMEYPMLISCGARLFTPEGRHSPEGVTVHEAGHQWFYGILGNDEVRHAFLDEGINTFAESSALAWGFGPDDKVVEFGPLSYRGVPLASPNVGGNDSGMPRWYELQVALGLGSGRIASYFSEVPPLTHRRERRSFPWPEREQWLRAAGADRIWRETWTYGAREDFRAHTYRLTALTLEAYRRAAGGPRLYRALRRYASEHWLGHPRPEDFIAAAEAAEEQLVAAAGAESGLRAAVDARRYFETVWTAPGFVDFRVRDVRCDDDEEDEGSDDPPVADCRVLVGRSGPWALPVEIEMTFADGSKELLVWDDGETWTAIESRGPRIVAVRVDPERRWVFDTDLTNNQWTSTPESDSAIRFFMGLLHETAQRLFAIGRAG
ncbi:MAG: M1 family metallopeptidase, partial [Acidobacteriota bacterium]|nr:M1 family metallopeptidase [Acidobacteriota bacterium]